MLEMASLGSRFFKFVPVNSLSKYGVPLRSYPSFDENTDGSFDQKFQDTVGTLITIDEGAVWNRQSSSGIAFNRDEAKIVIRGVLITIVSFCYLKSDWPRPISKSI